MDNQGMDHGEHIPVNIKAILGLLVIQKKSPLMATHHTLKYELNIID